MKQPILTILWKNSAKLLAAIILLACSFAGAFATLGDGNKKSDLPKKSLLSNKTATKPGSFSLRSGYNYRGNNVINTENERKYIRLNTVVTVQKGKTTFIVPLKKKVILNNVKIDIGNRQLKRN
ncbi:MAG: hypothetical protein JNK27_08950 [Chitinophagaceae bacterium]|nr:hypothetical protein [Chitinophagaceae bacterium]